MPSAWSGQMNTPEHRLLDRPLSAGPSPSGRLCARRGRRVAAGGVEAPAPSRLRHRGEGGDDRGLVLDGGREVLLGSAASDAVTEGVRRIIGRSVGSEDVAHGRLFLRSSVTQDTWVDAGDSRCFSPYYRNGAEGLGYTPFPSVTLATRTGTAPRPSDSAPDPRSPSPAPRRRSSPGRLPQRALRVRRDQHPRLDSLKHIGSRT